VIRSRLPLIHVLLVLGIFFLGSAGIGTPAERKGEIKGASHVNLRLGPDLRFSSIAILKEGDRVTVEEEIESWSRVSLPDGRTGYVRNSFVSVLPGSEQVETAPETKANPEPPPSVEPPQVPPAKMETALPKVLAEWESWRPLHWLVGSICVFLLGWILGGNYYLRRDRIRSRRLRF
jgi:hypothetical protein